MTAVSFSEVLHPIAEAPPLRYSHAVFPLTPALSPREREPARPRLDLFEGLSAVRAQDEILPLPWEEGRGEGKRGWRAAGTSGFTTGGRLSRAAWNPPS